MELTKDLVHENLSEQSSHFASSNHLSNHSLSSSSQTHSISNSNSNHCAQCNKKLRKRKALRQNAVEISDPFEDKLPGSQITLTPDLTNQNSSSPSLPTSTIQVQRPLSSTSTGSATSHSTNSRQLLCKHCRLRHDSFGSNQYSSNSKSDGSNQQSITSSTTTQSRREPGILSILRTTFSKLFDSKTSKSPTCKAKNHLDNSKNLRNGFPPLERRKSSSGSFGGRTSSRISCTSSTSHTNNNCEYLSGAESSSQADNNKQTSINSINNNNTNNNTNMNGLSHNDSHCNSITMSTDSNSIASTHNSSLGTLSASTTNNYCGYVNQPQHPLPQPLQQQQYQDQPDYRLLQLLCHHNQHLPCINQHQFHYPQHHHQYQHHHQNQNCLTLDCEIDYDKLNKYNPRIYEHTRRNTNHTIISNPANQNGNTNVNGNHNHVSALSHGCLLPTQSCPSKSKSLCSQFSKTNRSLLCSSWPPSGYRVYLNDQDDLFENDDILCEQIDRQSRNQYEFNIPFHDIRLGEIIKSGPRKKIYKGHWHGDVTVFMFENLDQEDRNRFWEKVSSFTMIRHENIVLFMGASIDPPHFLMVTSSCNGQSLYDKIHMCREKMRQSVKVNLMRQISQAVGYLHARNKPIIVKRLNSRNIYLEPKVVLSLLDYSHLDQDDIEILDQVLIPSHLVWYTAPEILSVSDEELPMTVPDEYFVQSTDIFSFGTLLYEIHTGRYPYSKSETKEFIRDVCSGRRPDIKDIRASDTVKNIIRECWSHDPLARPEFADISRELMKRDASRKRHSSSVPYNLNRDSNTMADNF